LVLLDDPNQGTFTDAVFTAAFEEAYDALMQAFVNNQCPRIQVISTYTLPVNTTSLTPEAAGWGNFADFDILEERLSGSSDKFTQLAQWDKLPQRSAFDRLIDFTWHYDTFYFVGATTSRELRVTYETSGQAPTSGTINVDGCLTFLARAAVAAVGDVKGYDEIAARNRILAYGPKYDQGMIGGELWRLVNTRVREMQHVQIAPKPFSLSRRRSFRRVPYVAAQQPNGVGMAPSQMSHAAGTITGTVDGSNDTFYLAYPVSSVVLILNGSTLTPTQHYVHSANQIIFYAPYIPQPGADILAETWL
jgi:hypothetical protein